MTPTTAEWGVRDGWGGTERLGGGWWNVRVCRAEVDFEGVSLYDSRLNMIDSIMRSRGLRGRCT